MNSTTVETVIIHATRPIQEDRPGASDATGLPAETGSRIEVNTALSRLARILRVLMGDAIVVDLDLNARASLVPLDRKSFELAILAVALEARNAMRGGGLFSIRTETGPCGTAEIALRDTGSGMTMESLEDLFGREVQENPAAAEPHLSAAFGIVRSAGGTMACETAVGRGTLFRILLPVASGEECAENVDPEIDYWLSGVAVHCLRTSSAA